jgi:hypothetical protein
MRSTSTRLTDAQVASYKRLLGTRDVRVLLLATLLSRLAGRMFTLAIVLYALARFGSPALAGWLAFAAMAPGLAISPIAGALIDRAGSVWAITVDMAASAACTAALIAADRLVPPTALDRANALDTAIHGVTDIVGPATAGAIVGLAGPMAVLGVIGVLYASAALCIARVRQPRGRLPRIGPLLAQAWSGLARVARQPTLRGLAVSYSLYQVSWGVLVVVVPVFAARQFVGGAGATIAGLLWAALGLAGAIAALTAGHWRTAGRERTVMALGLLATAAAAWPVAASLGLIGLVLGLMLIGAAEGPIDVSALTLRQRRTDPAELGRVLSVSMSLNMSGAPLGSALAGALVMWSLPATFAMAALTSMLAAAAVALIPQHED